MRNGRIEHAVEYEGMEPQRSLLPPVHEGMHGHNLIHEYMVFPQRFWFFTLAGLAGGLSRIDGPEAEIVLLLSREVGELARHIDASQFALHCVPVVNLYPGASERLKVDPQDKEHRLVPEVTAPDDHLVHSVNHIIGQVDDDATSEAIPFVPQDVALPNDERRDVRRFTVRRELELPTDNVRRYATHQPFVRTHTWLKLLRYDQQPDDSGVRYLSLDAWLTNGDLPCTLPRNGHDDLVVHGAKSVASVGFVRPPTMPGPPLARGEAAWKLLQQLNLEYGVFDDEHDEPCPGEGLRLMLEPYLAAAVPQMRRQLDGLTAAQAVPVNDWHRVARDMQFMRGIGITLEFDEAAFDDWSPFTFALVLERYVARHVSRHSFTRTTFSTKQRGAVFTWPARDGSVDEIYQVRPGDTLSSIAQAHGTTTASLTSINNIQNPDLVTVGQRLVVKRNGTCAVVPLFIDRDRNPIQGLRYRLESAGIAVFEGASRLNGLGERFFTKSEGDLVRILVQKRDGTWKLIHEAEAWAGEKLVTLKSGWVRFSTRTEPHPKTPDGMPVSDPPHHRKPKASPAGTPNKSQGDMQHPAAHGSAQGTKAQPTKTQQGATDTPHGLRQSGAWCPQCAHEKLKLRIEDMHAVARERGGECLSTAYLNNKTRLRWRCAHGHEWDAKPMHIRLGTWCPACARPSYTIADMRTLARERGGECPSQEYVNNLTKLQWRCKRGHEWSTTLATILADHWCPECAWLDRSTKEKTRRKYLAARACAADAADNHGV